MTEERKTQALMLPDETTFRRELMAVNRFQSIVHANLIKDQDYGIIPGTTKPTLLKPGAEKIAKLLGLADHYTIIDKQEDWEKPFFRYLIKCSLVNILAETTTSEGLGECNSMESKYRWRWLGERDLPTGIDKSKLVSQERRSKTGGHWRVYQVENEDIYSQVNTLIKMAKKRALVDAVLSAGRLSNIFTQDIEDILPEAVAKTSTISRASEPQKETTQPVNGGVIPDTTQADLREAELAAKQAYYKATPNDAPGPADKLTALTEKHKNSISPETSAPGPAHPAVELDFNPEWLKEKLKLIKWTEKTTKDYLKNVMMSPLPRTASISEMVAALSREAREDFFKKIGNLAEVA